jgi:hypothetical protein
MAYLLFKYSNVIFDRLGYLCVLFAAAAIFPVVQKQHQLLVTLLLCNACAMEVHNFLVAVLCAARICLKQCLASSF